MGDAALGAGGATSSTAAGRSASFGGLGGASTAGGGGGLGAGGDADGGGGLGGEGPPFVGTGIITGAVAAADGTPTDT